MARTSLSLTVTLTTLIVGVVAASPAEDRAVAILSKVGAKVVRDAHRPGQPVVTLYLNGANVNDAVIKELAGLTELQYLDLRRTAVTDAGCKDLAKLSQLRELYWFGAKVTNSGLKELARLKNLQKAYLIGARITDAGLKELVGLTNLQELNVSDTPITAAGERQLQKSLAQLPRDSLTSRAFKEPRTQ